MAIAHQENICRTVYMQWFDLNMHVHVAA